MIEIFKSVEGCVVRTEGFAPDTWINLVSPSEAEQAEVIEKLQLDPDVLGFALDEEEKSHIDVLPGQSLIMIDIPFATHSKDGMIFSTIPLAIIVTENNVITVCTKETSLVADIAKGAIKNVHLGMKTRFVLQVLYRVATKYVSSLKQIDKTSTEIEQQLQKSQKNKELLQLMGIEKSLVYFSTSLMANDVTLQKIQSGKVIHLYDEDNDLLEDVVVEIKQAIEMCTIYREILSGTTDNFASIVSNNLNNVMKVLTSLTLLMAVPTIVTGFFGMNVVLPFTDGIHMPIIISLVFVLLGGIYLRKKGMI